MNYYRLLKLVGKKIIPAPIKLLGIASLLVLHRRVIGIYIDPVLSCNLRCRMCYFSDTKRIHPQKTTITKDDVDNLRKLLLPYALKMQIGCGAEPTLYKETENLVKIAKNAHVPYISITTNGQLIGLRKTNLESLIESGLNEITLSLHGTDKTLYEDLMPGAKFENLLALIDQLADIKSRYPNFVIRINFTVNTKNLTCLKDNNFFSIWDERNIQPDIIQIRPVQKIGDSDWTDFDLTTIINNYEITIENIKTQCQKRKITCILPSRQHLENVDELQDGISGIIEDITYCYISPESFYKDDYDCLNDTFIKYHKRKNTVKKLIKAAFVGVNSINKNTSKKLNYSVKS